MKSNTAGFIIAILIAVIAIYFLLPPLKKENFGGCASSNSINNDMPKDGASACKQISSKAQDITAAANGQANVLANIPFFSLFDPTNYKSGTNAVADNMRNIITTNLSSCEMQAIQSACTNATTNNQQNIIDNTKCTYCNNHECSITGATQTNTANLQQTCTIQAAMQALTEKTNSVEAQALASVLQKADGVLSGNNNVQSDNCNIISQDLSSQTYIQQKNTCLNQITLDQLNSLQFCGNITGTIQSNINDQIQSCMLTTKQASTNNTTSDTSAKTATKNDQSSTGINTADSLISGVVSCVFSALVVFAFYYYVENGGALPGSQSE